MTKNEMRDSSEDLYLEFKSLLNERYWEFYDILDDFEDLLDEFIEREGEDDEI